jgi:hypothetical protein
MVEDNPLPLDIENIKEKQDNDNELQQSATVARHLTTLQMCCATPNQVMIHLIGK